MLIKIDQRIDAYIARLTIKQSVCWLIGFLFALGCCALLMARLLQLSWIASVLVGVGVMAAICLYLALRVIVLTIIKVRQGI